MRLITSIVALSMLLGCSSQHMSINSTNKSDLSKKTQEKTEQLHLTENKTKIQAKL